MASSTLHTRAGIDALEPHEVALAQYAVTNGTLELDGGIRQRLADRYAHELVPALQAIGGGSRNVRDHLWLASVIDGTTPLTATERSELNQHVTRGLLAADLRLQERLVTPLHEMGEAAYTATAYPGMVIGSAVGLIGTLGIGYGAKLLSDAAMANLPGAAGMAASAPALLVALAAIPGAYLAAVGGIDAGKHLATLPFRVKWAEAARALAARVKAAVGRPRAMDPEEVVARLAADTSPTLTSLRTNTRVPMRPAHAAQAKAASRDHLGI